LKRKKGKGERKEVATGKRLHESENSKRQKRIRDLVKLMVVGVVAVADVDTKL